MTNAPIDADQKQFSADLRNSIPFTHLFLILFWLVFLLFCALAVLTCFASLCAVLLVFRRKSEQNMQSCSYFAIMRQLFCFPMKRKRKKASTEMENCQFCFRWYANRFADNVYYYAQQVHDLYTSTFRNRFNKWFGCSNKSKGGNKIDANEPLGHWLRCQFFNLEEKKIVDVSQSQFLICTQKRLSNKVKKIVSTCCLPYGLWLLLYKKLNLLRWKISKMSQNVYHLVIFSLHSFIAIVSSAIVIIVRSVCYYATQWVHTTRFSLIKNFLFL